MTKRLDYSRFAKDSYQAVLALHRSVEAGGLDKRLQHLVKLRASQINGCAYCLEMHTKDLLAIGIPEAHVFTLSAWQETPFFTDAERAALRWTEELTLISESHASDEAYAELRAHFDEEEVMALTHAVIVINIWNRLSVGFRSEPGQYVSRLKPLAAAAG